VLKGSLGPRFFEGVKAAAISRPIASQACFWISASWEVSVLAVPMSRRMAAASKPIAVAQIA
jgi:hypothetical protein